MTEIKYGQEASRLARKRTIVGFLFAISIALGAFFIVDGCTSNVSPTAINVALKKEGKIYLYSSMGTFIVSESIEKKQSPAAPAAFEIFEEEGKFYVAPNNMKPLVDVMASNVEVFPYIEKSFEGYITSASGGAYELNSKYESTEVIGEQISSFTATLRRGDGKEMLVRWEINQKSGEFHAIENCEIKPFWCQTNPMPGETVIASQDFLVISIESLQEFFECKVDYDKETQMLYIEE